MYKGIEIIGLPVVEINTGRVLGEVEDIIFSEFDGLVKGFVIRNKNKYFLETHNINRIGEDAITVLSQDLLKPWEEHNTVEENEQTFQTLNNTIFGERVMTTSGKEVGKVKDLIIDENKNSVIGFELTEGVIQDLLEGRNLLPLSNNLIYGQDTLLLDEEGV
ncbi:PRC-barrel domain-containing protein [Halothermothrix orenii]|uniref:PRC-barrel domain protein n=1 Tax=Halothermothrix orenii (strain H 168 / OCM 544 / DSM 9562) TaxID=373903 RepID=B8D2A2_HALOH|nr:PRC-barrel domain-containing protein [Halothermothrix orenii]ACL69329.1 PRC-barrel domain protein [Halothermothrix orenii H 168]